MHSSTILWKKFISTKKIGASTKKNFSRGTNFFVRFRHTKCIAPSFLWKKKKFLSRGIYFFGRFKPSKCIIPRFLCRKNFFLLKAPIFMADIGIQKHNSTIFVKKIIFFTKSWSYAFCMPTKKFGASAQSRGNNFFFCLYKKN